MGSTSLHGRHRRDRWRVRLSATGDAATGRTAVVRRRADGRSGSPATMDRSVRVCVDRRHRAASHQLDRSSPRRCALPRLPSRPERDASTAPRCRPHARPPSCPLVYDSAMRTQLPPTALQRDSRFNRITTEERFADERPNDQGQDRRMDPDAIESFDRARRQMHGIFVGEIQALEGAGRTAFDYTTAETPLQLKLDMARQCWDEARHVEISLRLGEHMGTEVGEFSEAVTLFEAACHADPVFRLAGVNRALEGLAIDVFTTMRDFAEEMSDPVLYFCEDWMLADEVTHVKMGSTWLRELTKDDKERQSRALEFQRTVDSLFNFRGSRGEGNEAAIRLARKFREMAGFKQEEIDQIAEMAQAQRDQNAARVAA